MIENKLDIVVIDGHPIVRHGITSILTDSQEFRVRDGIYNEKTGLSAIRVLQPDMVILDIALNGNINIDLINDIKDVNPEIVVIVYTSHHRPASIVKAMKLGATGYILKSDPVYEFKHAINSCIEGGGFLSSSISTKNFTELTDESANGRSLFDLLTKREREIARLLSKGLTTKKLSDMLFISPNTVRNHRRSIMAKFSCEHPNDLLLLLQKVICTDKTSTKPT